MTMMQTLLSSGSQPWLRTRFIQEIFLKYQHPAPMPKDSDSVGVGPFKKFFPGDCNVQLGQKTTTLGKVADSESYK